MRLAVILQRRRASAGEIGGMIGKKLGFGSARDLPVIRQNDIFCVFLFSSDWIQIQIKTFSICLGRLEKIALGCVTETSPNVG